MNVLLQNKVRRFLECSQMNKTDFCRGVPISVSSLNEWLRSEREISLKAENRISDFMASYVKQLIEISQ